jgi:hypothetical protein
VAGGCAVSEADAPEAVNRDELHTSGTAVPSSPHKVELSVLLSYTHHGALGPAAIPPPIDQMQVCVTPPGIARHRCPETAR